MWNLDVIEPTEPHFIMIRNYLLILSSTGGKKERNLGRCAFYTVN